MARYDPGLVTVSDAIKYPTARVVLLADITVRMHARAWVADGTYTTTHKIATQFADRRGKSHKQVISAVSVDGESVTLRASAAALDAAADGWHHDGTHLWIKAPAGHSVFGSVWIASCKFYLSNCAKTLNDIFWSPRFQSAPAISHRIEAVFGDVRQISGGDLTLTNNDGFFDGLSGLLWNRAKIAILIGVDVWGPTVGSGDMAWLDYETMANWRVNEWRNNGNEFELKLVDAKAAVKAKLPLDVFTRESYPNIDDDDVGRPIPIAYGYLTGIEPIVINPGTKTFKVAGHAIRSFDGVTIERTRVESLTRTLATESWLAFSGTARRYYIADEVVKSVEFNSVELTEENDRDDVTATAGTWAYSGNYVYVNPPSGDDWTAASVAVTSEKSSPSFVATNFASVDAANGEFTLGDDWSIGSKISVDFRGKVNGDGEFMENAIDIAEDIFTTAGETSMDSGLFGVARAKLKLGTDENNDDVHYLRPALYIDEPEELMDVIGELCRFSRSYVYSDDTGQYVIGVFEPEPSESLPVIDDSEILSKEETFDASDMITRVISKYQNRPTNGYAQTEITDADGLDDVNGNPAPAASDVDLPTYYERDAEYWNQAELIMSGRPLAVHQFVVPWKYLTLDPGNQVVVESDSYAISGVFEVLEKRIDVASKHVTLIVGNLRGFGDEPGFWAADPATVPSRFSALTGYGAGSATWNSSWDDEIKSWARRNVGYWTDANGFAGTADSESFNASVWT